MTVLFLPKTVSSFALVLLYCLCKSLQRSLFLIPSVLSESGCKGKEFFVYPPNFCGTFFEVFFSKLSFKIHFSKAGAKVRSYFQTTKCFEKFFPKVFSKASGGRSSPLGPLSCERRESHLPLKDNFIKNHLQQHVKYHRFVSESGCKSTAYSDNCKLTNGFFRHFLELFSQIADLQLCFIAGFSKTKCTR